MRRFLLITVCSLCIITAHAQKYGTSLGLRLGDQRYGISLRQRVMSGFTGELLFEVEPAAYQLTVLPKYHLPLIGEGLNLYMGAGAHVGELKHFGTTYGFDLMVGIEWKLPLLPLTLSTDIKPAYNVQDQDWFEFPAAISVHYVLAKETKSKRQKKRKKRRKRKARKERREERKEARNAWWQETFGGQNQD